MFARRNEGPRSEVGDGDPGHGVNRVVGVIKNEEGSTKTQPHASTSARHGDSGRAAWRFGQAGQAAGRKKEEKPKIAHTNIDPNLADMTNGSGPSTHRMLDSRCERLALAVDRRCWVPVDEGRVERVGSKRVFSQHQVLQLQLIQKASASTDPTPLTLQLQFISKAARPKHTARRDGDVMASKVEENTATPGATPGADPVCQLPGTEGGENQEQTRTSDDLRHLRELSEQSKTVPLPQLNEDAV